MSVYYLDSSALVKRYADEQGSQWIRQITDLLSENIILLAEITLAEVAAALSAKHRAPGGLTCAQRDAALSLFLQDCAEAFIILTIDRAVIDRAVELTQHYRLRGYDAVQLATALVNSDILIAEHQIAPIFVTSDTDLIAAARAEHLLTDDPMLHQERSRDSKI